MNKARLIKKDSLMEPQPKPTKVEPRPAAKPARPLSKPSTNPRAAFYALFTKGKT